MGNLLIADSPRTTDNLSMRKPLVAFVGRPNVGKSTLFNRFVGDRIAVVDNVAGTTRDRIVSEVFWNGVTFDLVDTGGLEIPNLNEKPLAINSARFVPEIQAQTSLAIGEADLVVFMTDLQNGITPADTEVAELLRKQQRVEDGERTPPIILAVNKSESPNLSNDVYEFYALGLGDPYPVSALHGDGTGDLLDKIIEMLPDAPEETEDENLKLVLVGRPNVGKSSLLNKLLGEDRAIVSPIAGTTRDAIDTYLDYDGEPITLIDTAGMRKRGKIDAGVEKYSVLRAARAIERCDIALLVIDATEPFTLQDAHIAGMIVDNMKSAVIVVNKWDAVEKDTHTMHEFTQNLRDAFKFLDYAPVLFISALSGQRVQNVLPTVMEVFEERNKRISTAQVNRTLRDALNAHPPPTKKGKRLKILYGSQVRTSPPIFLFSVNDEQLVHFTYKRFLENRIRREYAFTGTPIRLSFRNRSED